MEAIVSRHSVRAYKEEKIGSGIREKLDALVRQVNEESGLDITIEYDNPEGFDSKLAHYGNFRNVGNFIILKGKDMPDFEERCGYYGEKIVLEAQMLGLNTCWAALTFNKKMVKQLVPGGERFAMVIALGYGETSGTPRKSKDMSEVVATKGNMPEWFEKGAKAALLAPTAVNQQKFKMGLVGGEPVIKVEGVGFYTKTDLGIVKYHFEVASGRKVR
jgi:nitroreductase